MEKMRRGGPINPRHGEQHPRAKLTAKQVAEIIELSHTLSYGQIATRFGVHRATVRDIIKCRTWVTYEI